MSVSPLTPLDYIAEGYWQDFLAERPVAGGIAYEAELHAGRLDTSLESLQRIDTLLSYVRRDLIKGGIWDEESLLSDERHRNFMMFLAFYAGRVLAQQMQNTPHWYGQFELRKRYPNLPLTADNFYQHMAVNYTENSIENDTSSLFFALEPIGQRLFGHIDRQIEAVQGGQVDSGLYHAVTARLSNTHNLHSAVGTETTNVNSASPKSVNSESASQYTAQRVDSSLDTDSRVSTSQLNAHTSSSTQTISSNSAVASAEHSITSNVSTNNGMDTDIDDIRIATEPDSAFIPEISDSHPRAETVEPASNLAPELAKTTPLVNASAPPAPLSKALSTPTVQKKTAPTPEMFVQLFTDLNEVEVVQTAGNAEYQQACRILDQFEQYIAKQTIPRDQIAFTDGHLAEKKQALRSLQAAAEAGHTAAMLRLAMYELLDEGLAAESDHEQTPSGTEWIKQAASKDDSRAQRLLSRMYYQGVSVSQDIANGKYWLEQAADNGHPEAISLVQQWQQADALLTTQKQEQHSTKRYQLLFAIVIVVALLILIVV